MAGISKDILVVQKENYRRKNAKFGFSPGDFFDRVGGEPQPDRIRNYYGLHQTDMVRKDGTYLNPGYNDPMEASISTLQGSNSNSQKLVVNGGVENLELQVVDRPLGDEIKITQDIVITDLDPTATDLPMGNDWAPDGEQIGDNLLRIKLQKAGLAAMTNNSVFYDHTFLTPGAYSKTELNSLNIGVAAYCYDARPKYSYFAEGYESAVSAPGTEIYETLLPNIHAFIAEVMYGPAHNPPVPPLPVDPNDRRWPPPQPPPAPPVEPTIYERLITLDGRIRDIYTDILNPSPVPFNDLGDKIGEADRGEGYFKKYYLALKSGRIEPGSVVDLAEAYKKVLFSGNDVHNSTVGRVHRGALRKSGIVEGGRPGRILATSYERRNLFPLYNLMQFSTQRELTTVGYFTTLHISDLLLAQMYTKDTKVESRIIVSKNDVGVSEGSRQELYDQERLGQYNLQDPIWDPELGMYVVSSEARIHSRAQSHSENTVVHNVGFDFDSFHDFITSSPGEFDGVYYGDKGVTSLDELTKVTNTYSGIYKFEQVYRTKRRSYLDIITGKMAHSEVLAYKIEKYLMIDSGAPSLISTTIIPNQVDLDVINYVDTQIKYGEPYRYEVKQMVLVYGSKIEFKKGDNEDIGTIKYATEANDVDVLWYKPSRKPPFRQATSRHATAKVEVTPDIKVYEIPYFNTDTLKAVVTPPSPPHIGLVPYKNVDNKILINIDNSIDEYVDAPVILDSADAQNAADVIRMQGDVYGGKIRFSGKTTGKEIENYIIYRTTRRPGSYDDFTNKEIATASTTVQGLKSSSAAYKDTIQPNTKYYYIVRTVDRHGFRSNPSTIYEVEIVSNSGTIYPIIRTVDLSNRPDGRTTSKPMRKHIQIKPNFLQTMAKMQDGQTGMGDINLEDLIWDDNDTLNIGAWRDDARSFDSLTIGAAQQSIWRKSFKVRFTSKQTGKKIDLNMTFRLRRDNS